MEKYSAISYYDVIDVTGNMSAEEYESAVRQIEEELFADAYAGINAFGAGAERFTEAVNEKMDSLYLGKTKAQDNGTAEPKGPPAEQSAATTERFSADEDVPGLSLPTLEDVDGETSGQKENTARGGVRYSTDLLDTSNAPAKYDYTKPFAAQLSDYQSGKILGDDALVIGATPNVLRKIGMAGLPMTINQKHIGDALNGTYKGTPQEIQDHTFTVQELSSLPEKIADPIAVIYDKRVGKANASESNVDVIVEMAVASGKQVLVAVQINGNGRVNGIRIDTNKVATVHGNTDCLTRLVEAINENEKGNVAVFYINKDKTTKVLQRTGNPIPSGLSNLDGFIHSINDPGSPVKSRVSNVTESQQFKRWFGDWQNHPENSSKVVNADGTPKVVYHGSAEQFTTFSYGHIGSSTGVGILGDGFYFTDKKRLAKGYGKNLYPVYLQMKNPYIATESDAYKLRTEDIQQQGYDGVVLRAPQGDVYMVFENTQIKSATDNIGTFDGNNPDIRYSVDDAAEDDIQGLSLPTLEEDSVQNDYIKGDISRETIEADIVRVAHMEPVAQITGEEFAKGEKDLVTQVTEFFAELNNRAYNPQLGSVMLDRQGVRSDIAHGIGRKKAAAFAAVPDVLARGYVVDYQKNWKGRGYDTAVVAAPVRIGSDEYLMGIVLNRNQAENKFYVHEVLTTENGAPPFKTGTRKGNPSGDAPSILSILERILNVKANNGGTERYSVDDSIEEDIPGLSLPSLNDAETATVDDADSVGTDAGLQMLRLIERIERGDFLPNEKVSFGTVATDIADRIKSITGIDVTGYSVEIEARQIEHILKDHGENGITDRTMANPKDIAKMEYVLEHPDDIRPGERTSAYVSNVNGRNRRAGTVIYEKELGDKSYYVVQAVPQTSKKTLYIVTAFVGKGGYRIGDPQSTNAKSPGATPEAESAKSPTDSISQGTANVKANNGGTERYSVDDSAEQEKKPAKKATKPLVESKPIIAKRDLWHIAFMIFVSHHCTKK